MPVEESLGQLARLREEGKIRHIGLYQVSVAEIDQARKITEIVSVQNSYNLADRRYEDVLDHCTAENLAFVPWFPIATGGLAEPGGPLTGIGRATPSQLVLAWLLRRSPVVLPMPGTSSVTHPEENVAAAAVRLSDEEFATLANAIRS